MCVYIYFSPVLSWLFSWTRLRLFCVDSACVLEVEGRVAYRLVRIFLRVGMPICLNFNVSGESSVYVSNKSVQLFTEGVKDESGYSGFYRTCSQYNTGGKPFLSLTEDVPGGKKKRLGRIPKLV